MKKKDISLKNKNKVLTKNFIKKNINIRIEIQTYIKSIESSGQKNIENKKIIEFLKKVYIESFIFTEQKKTTNEKNYSNLPVDVIISHFRHEVEQSKLFSPIYEERPIKESTFIKNTTLKTISTYLNQLSVKKLTNKQLLEIQNIIFLVTQREGQIKYLNNKQHFSNFTHKSLPQLFDKFTKSMEKLRLESTLTIDINSRKYKTTLKYKITFVLTNLIKTITKSDEFTFLSPLNKLTIKDFDIIFDKYLLNEDIFNSFISIVFKSSYESTVNILDFFEDEKPEIGDIEFNNRFTTVAFTVFYQFKDFLLIYYVQIITIYVNDSRKDLLDEIQNSTVPDIQFQKYEIRHEILEQVGTWLFNNKKLYAFSVSKSSDSFIWYGIHCDSSKTLALIFESLDFMKVTTAYDEKINKSYKKYVLPNGVEHLVTSYIKFPLLLKPISYTSMTFKSRIVPILFGSSDSTSGEGLLVLLTALESKSFSVNPRFLLLIKYFISEKAEYKTFGFDDVELEVPRHDDVNLALSNKIQNKGGYISANRLELAIYSEIENIVKNANIYTTSKLPLKYCANMVKFDDCIYSYQKDVDIEFNKINDQVRYVKTLISICDALYGFSFFIENKFCSRLRMYPIQNMLSRTSGVFKHLVQEGKLTVLTRSGLISLLEAYYKSDPVLHESFKIFIIKYNLLYSVECFEVLELFWVTHPLNFKTLSKNALYYMNLHNEIQFAFEYKSTAVCIEIDQRASGICFLAIITGNKELAMKCNIISKEKCCIYTYLAENVENFYNTLKFNDPFVKELLVNNRKLFKQALMCYSYSQKTQSRYDKIFLEGFKEKFGHSPDFHAGRSLFEFCANFEKYIDSLFPGFPAQMKRLLFIVNFCACRGAKLQVKTLDGQVLTWEFFSHDTKVRASYLPSIGEYVKYKVSFYKVNDVGGHVNYTLDEKALKRCFLPFYIHSIDAGVIREIAKEFISKGYVPNTLHDCVLIHPNQADLFFDIIKKIYSSHKLFNIIDFTLFEPLRSQLPEEYIPEFDELVKEYKSHCADFSDDIGNFEPRNLYDFE